jgi:hypothetical protein
MNVRRTVSFLILSLVLLALPIAFRLASFYVGRFPEREVNRPQLDQIEVPTPPAAQYADETVSPGEGVVVVDMAHENRVEMAELNVLAGRLAARGHQLVEWTDGDPEEMLLEASALIVAVPLESYDAEEVAAVQEFVAGGGRVLLIGDPTRYNYLVDEWDWITGVDSDAGYLNSLSAPFGITFVDDYLYNVSDNEGNYRNIRLTDWSEGTLTEGLDSVVFYAAHSLAVADEGALILADEDTWSSATDRAGGLVVAAQTMKGQVLALGDLTFMTEPYHTVHDNNRLIASIADFLTGAERTYDLFDFPLSFGAKVAFVYTNDPELGPAQLQLVDDYERIFEEHDRVLVLADAPDTRADTIFAGIYSQAGPITATLSELGVTLVYTPALETEEAEEADETGASAETEVEGEETAEEAGETEEPEEEGPELEPEGRVLVEGLGNYDMSGIGLVAYRGGDEQKLLVVLAASQEGLANVLGRLPDRDFDDCVQAETITLCPTGVLSEEIEPSWEPLEAEAEEGEPEEGEEEPEGDGEQPEGLAGELVYGDSVSDELEPGEDHLWRFEGTEGDIVTILVETTSPDMDLVLELEDADGTVLTTADDNLSGESEEIRNYELPDTGEYTIRVGDFWDEGGPYTLSLERGTGEEEEISAGVIAFGETVEGTLDENRQALWTFSGEAEQAVTIVLQPDEESDMSLELKDPDGVTLQVSDSGYSGEEERIEGLLPATGDYQIVVREYWGEAGTYTLTLSEGGEGGILGGSGVLVVSADIGTPTGEGLTGASLIYDILSPEYDVTLWTLSLDGEISIEEMEDYKLVIWCSGDYEGGEDFVLFEYLFAGGSLMVTGAYTVFFEGEETALLRDLEVSSVASDLTSGFTRGEVIELTGETEAAVFDSTEDEEGIVPLFLRGPASEQAGDVIAAGLDDELEAVRALVVGFPFYMIPDEVQVQLLANAMAWFQLTPSS